MSFKDKVIFVVKLIFSVYLGSAVGYIIMSMGSTKTDYFFKALGPVNLYNEIAAGNMVVILFAGIGVVFFILFK